MPSQFSTVRINFSFAFARSLAISLPCFFLFRWGAILPCVLRKHPTKDDRNRPSGYISCWEVLPFTPTNWVTTVDQVKAEKKK